MGEPDDPRTTAITLGVGTAGAALGAIAGGPVGATAAYLGVELVSRAIKGAWENRGNRLVAAVAAHRRLGSLDEAAEALNKAASTAHGRTALLDAFRTLMSVLEEDAIPYVGVLTSMYLDGRKPDAAFRSIGSLLQTLDSEAIQTLRWLVATADAPDWKNTIVLRRKMYPRKADSPPAPLGGKLAVRHLLKLMKRAGLAWDPDPDDLTRRGEKLLAVDGAEIDCPTYRVLVQVVNGVPDIPM